jgi:hypothetical protein
VSVSSTPQTSPRPLFCPSQTRHTGRLESMHMAGTYKESPHMYARLCFLFLPIPSQCTRKVEVGQCSARQSRAGRDGAASGLRDMSLGASNATPYNSSRIQSSFLPRWSGLTVPEAVHPRPTLAAWRDGRRSAARTF